MRMKTPWLILAAGLLFVGAGCNSSDSPVSLDKYQSPPTASDQGLTSPSTSTDQGSERIGEAATPNATPSSTTSETSSSSTSSTPSVTSPAPLAFPGVLPASETKGKFVHLQTSKGNIVFELLPDQGPKAASNFIYLAKQKFYDGLTFHRVVPGFVIQGGDPLGTGTGGPGYQFEDDPVHVPYSAGIVAMANAGPNTNGSQFFIMLEDNPLPPSYSVFGRVISGMDVVRKIQVGDKMTTVTVESKK